MIDVLLIRHGRTAWNARGRIQGQRDIRLSEIGRAELAARRIPSQYTRYRWYASPLARAVETARILGARDLRTDRDRSALHPVSSATASSRGRAARKTSPPSAHASQRPSS